MKKNALLVLALVGTLTACVPDGYEDAPAMRDYLSTLLPDAGKASVTEVSVCKNNGRMEATVMFEDQMLLTYEIMDQGETPVMRLRSQSTRAQRNELQDREGVLDLDCLGYRPRSHNGFTMLGSYRFTLDKSGVSNAYARTFTVVNYPFDDRIRKLLAQAAGAVNSAIEEHKKFTPPEQTWGAKP